MSTLLGLTVGVLIASAGLTISDGQGAKSPHRVDHSWQLVVSLTFSLP